MPFEINIFLKNFNIVYCMTENTIFNHWGVTKLFVEQPRLHGSANILKVSLIKQAPKELAEDATQDTVHHFRSTIYWRLSFVYYLVSIVSYIFSAPVRPKAGNCIIKSQPLKIRKKTKRWVH